MGDPSAAHHASRWAAPKHDPRPETIDREREGDQAPVHGRNTAIDLSSAASAAGLNLCSRSAMIPTPVIVSPISVLRRRTARLSFLRFRDGCRPDVILMSGPAVRVLRSWRTTHHHGLRRRRKVWRPLGSVHVSAQKSILLQPMRTSRIAAAVTSGGRYTYN